MKHIRDIKIGIASLIIGLTIGLVGVSFGGSGTISDAVPGTTIFASDFNKITSALKVDLVPRNSSGIATAEGGNLGSSTYPWGAIFFGDPASQAQISDAGNEINFRVGGNIEARIGTTGLTLDSLADGLITYAKLNSNAIFKLKKFTTTQAVPAGVTEIIVVGCGGGGGGGGGGLNTAAGNTSGGGGGAGGQLGTVTHPVTALSTVTITVGSGGAGGAGAAVAGATATAGSPGTSTTVTGSFGTITFAGGLGGPGGDDIAISGAAAAYRGGSSSSGGGGSTAGVFGTPSAGDFSAFALGGAAGANGPSGTGGGGGGGGYGPGGAGGPGVNSTAGAVGIAGGTCGGGGGGGGSTNLAPGTGGAGGAGYAAVYYVAP